MSPPPLSPLKMMMHSTVVSRNDENSDPSPADAKALPTGVRQSANRFGFKTRLPPPPAAEEADDLLAPTVDVASIDFTRYVEECLGDLEAATPLLKARAIVGKLDFKQAKAKVAELSDLVRQLKAALAEQLRRARTLAPTLAEAQREVHARLRAQCDAMCASRGELQRLQRELGASVHRADERARKVKELRELSHELTEREADAAQRADEESERAERAEAQASELDAQLIEVRAQVEELSSKLADRQAAAAAAEAKSQEERAAHAAAAAEAKAELEQLRAASQQEARSSPSLLRADLKKALKEEEARTAQLSTQLSEANSAHAELVEAHAALERDCRSAQDKCTAQAHCPTIRDMPALEKQLAEKTSLLASKDNDLREAIQNVTQIQRNSMEQVQHERQRVESLDENLRALRLRESELTVALDGTRQELERLQSEHGQCKSELREVQTAMLYSNSERERLAIETAEQKDLIQLKSTQCAKMDASLKEMSQQLAGTTASLAAKSEQEKQM
ncbi:hypothetical protein AB1Y20_007115 [Prymnesium parvum]|uniref:Uncharacterized protein n=1 Tax=Prymnesium parvum TaxID=97485 RepID=A0AB34J3M0_PRYPA